MGGLVSYLFLFLLLSFILLQQLNQPAPVFLPLLKGVGGWVGGWMGWID